MSSAPAHITQGSAVASKPDHPPVAGFLDGHHRSHKVRAPVDVHRRAGDIPVTPRRQVGGDGGDLLWKPGATEIAQLRTYRIRLHTEPITLAGSR